MAWVIQKNISPSFKVLNKDSKLANHISIYDYKLKIEEFCNGHELKYIYNSQYYKKNQYSTYDIEDNSEDIDSKARLIEETKKEECCIYLKQELLLISWEFFFYERKEPDKTI